METEHIFAQDDYLSEEQKAIFGQMAWKNDDKIVRNTSENHKGIHIILGVIKLNEISEGDFVHELYKYSNVLIKRVKNTDNKNVIWKHNINNGIFTPLQLNKNLSKEKYEIINTIRERLWSVNEGEYLNFIELNALFGFNT